MLHAVVIALATGVRSVRIGVGPRFVEIVYMEVERHDPVAANGSSSLSLPRRSEAGGQELHPCEV